MQINPGGRLDPADVRGRDEAIERYWKILRRQGLVLSAERRIGKTHIVLKMHADGRDGFLTFYQDLEGVHGTLELIKSLYETVHDSVSKGAQLWSGFINLWDSLAPKRIGDLELPDAKKHWKQLLTEAINDTLDNSPDETIIVFIWDEFPLMIYNIGKAEGPEVAIELLDLLRQIRQKNGERLRFIFTGSIGLHLVLQSLKLHGNANEPINDMFPEVVQPLNELAAQALVRELLENIPHNTEDAPAISENIARKMQGFPYHIQLVMDQLQQLGRPITGKDIVSSVNALTQTATDPAHSKYYFDRIRLYYDGMEKPALAVLDALAESDTYLTRDKLSNSPHLVKAGCNEDQIREALLLLREDHYLDIQTDDGISSYQFRWNLVKAWWRSSRL